MTRVFFDDFDLRLAGTLMKDAIQLPAMQEIFKEHKGNVKAADPAIKPCISIPLEIEGQFHHGGLMGFLQRSMEKIADPIELGIPLMPGIRFNKINAAPSDYSWAGFFPEACKDAKCTDEGCGDHKAKKTSGRFEFSEADANKVIAFVGDALDNYLEQDEDHVPTLRQQGMKISLAYDKASVNVYSEARVIMSGACAGCGIKDQTLRGLEAATAGMIQGDPRYAVLRKRDFKLRWEMAAMNLDDAKKSFAQPTKSIDPTTVRTAVTLRGRQI